MTHSTGLLPALLLLLIATACDLRRREVPDAIPALILASALGAIALGFGMVSPVSALLGFLAGVAIGLLLFRFCSFGGGDVKLIMALGACLGPSGLLALLFYVAVFGGFLGVLARLRGQREFAYVPAIAAGLLALIAVRELPR